ncbi:hypothetical protein Adi01nite_50340 [Amorphoplanes digitatis]|nr:hypothetical protein GCM10020092_105790 [Actinoplanes digitatis]GID95622.1 hypothetical protein Adi01nite_50340 [Actinoplanes digitatis]
MPDLRPLQLQQGLAHPHGLAAVEGAAARQRVPGLQHLESVGVPLAEVGAESRRESPPHGAQIGGGTEQFRPVDLFIVFGAIAMAGQFGRRTDQNRELSLERQIAID